MFLPRDLCGPVLPSAGFVRQLYASCRTIPLRLIGVKRRRRCGRSGGAMLQNGIAPSGGPAPAEAVEHFDVLFVGAGLSGVGAAYHLQQGSPRRSYVILEGREAIGGTWDLFRYPGIRSDSDMYTLGYSFRPWEEAKAIADGPSILRYVNDTADRYGIRRAHPLPPPGQARRLVLGRSALAGRGRAHRQRRAGPLHLQLAPHVQRLLQLCRGLRSRIPGPGELPGQDRPPAILAGGPGLCRQEGGGHRQRRHRGDDRPGNGEDGGARRHAAALADLHGLAPLRGHDRQRPAQDPAVQARLRNHPLEERPPADVLLQPRPQTAGQGEGEAARRGQEASPRRL